MRYSSSLAISSRSGSTSVTGSLSASLRVLQSWSSSGRQMVKSMQRSLQRLCTSSSASFHIWKSFSVNLRLLESTTSASLPLAKRPQTHFISCGQTRMPWPWNCPFSNSPTYLLPLLKNFSPQVSSWEALQQPRSMLLRQSAFVPETSRFSAYMRKASPWTSPSESKQPMVSSLPACLMCMVSGFSKVRANACSCLRPTSLAMEARLKASSLFLRLRCRIFSVSAPRFQTSSQILLVQQSMSTPTPCGLSPSKGTLRMQRAALQATSYSEAVLQSTEAMELSRKMMLWPEGVSCRYSVTTAAPSSCSSSPRPCFLQALMPPWQTALLQWQKYFQWLMEGLVTRRDPLPSCSSRRDISSATLERVGDCLRICYILQR